MSEALILAGGKGTRLRSAVADRPKVLAEVAGRPFLAHLLDQVVVAGVSRVVLCTGYMAEMVEETFGASYGGMELAYSVESEPLGTGGALRLAAEQVRGDEVLVMNGDSYFGADLAALRQFHRDKGAKATLALARVPDVSRYGMVQTDGDGRILSFLEKGGAERPGQINAGIYLIRTAELLALPTGRAVSLEREIFPGWLGGAFYGLPTTATFIDIGTPSSFAKAQEVFAS